MGDYYNRFSHNLCIFVALCTMAYWYLSGNSTMVDLPASGLNVTITGNTVFSDGGSITVEFQK